MTSTIVAKIIIALCSYCPCWGSSGLNHDNQWYDDLHSAAMAIGNWRILASQVPQPLLYTLRNCLGWGFPQSIDRCQSSPDTKSTKVGKFENGWSFLFGEICHGGGEDKSFINRFPWLLLPSSYHHHNPPSLIAIVINKIIIIIVIVIIIIIIIIIISFTYISTLSTLIPQAVVASSRTVWISNFSKLLNWKHFTAYL